MTDLDQLESRRLQLEKNVAKLRKSLQHWRTWDAEYEGLKEELQGGATVESETDCAHISDEFAGELVTQKEIYDLFGIGKGPVREPSEVIRLIDRRLDYVQQNVATISKQLTSVEYQLSGVVEEMDKDSEDTEAAGLPMTEITEELDEDGNIISSKVSQPENSTAQLIDTLRKAGLTDVDKNFEKPTTGDDSTEDLEVQETTPKGKEPDSKTIASASKETSQDGNSRKSVKFAESVEERTIPPISNINKQPPTTTSSANSSLARGSFNSNERVIEIDDDDEMIGAVIPEDESPEDARLRREMLQYNLNEVGQVVAELDLDEDLSEYEDADYDFEDEYDSEISEEEDEHGRSIRPGVSKDYKQQMLDLEEKLKSRVIGNLGPVPDGVDPVIDPDDFRRLVVRQDEEQAKENTKPEKGKGKDQTKSETPAKKGVRFAESLDIQEAPKPAQPAPQPKPKAAVAPIADIIERKPTTQTSAPAGKPAKVSRFKQSRTTESSPTTSSTPQTPQEQPVLSQKVLERAPATPNPTTTAPDAETSEFDPEIQQRQLAAEYYRMRNNIIKQQGGFKASEEEADDPLMEEREDGQVRKVSRFKAARMKF